MGFFSKIFKGVKKVFKKIGRGIKKVVSGVGKFMDKIGVVGQIGLSFLLPGIGSLLSSTLGSVGAWAATGGSNWLIQGAKAVVGGAAKFASTAGRVFNTVGSGVKNFVGEFAKTAASKLGFNIESASSNFFGADGAFGKAFAETGDTWKEGFGSIKPMEDVVAEMVPTPTDPETFEQIAEKAGVPTDDVVGNSYGVGGEEGLLTRPRMPPEGIPSMDINASSEALEFPRVQEPLYTSVEMPNLGVDTPDLTLGDRETTFLQNVYDEAQERVTSMVEKPISTAFNAFKAIASEDEYDYSDIGSYGASGDIIASGMAPIVQPSAPVNMSATAFGYPQAQLDSVYRPSGAYSRFLGSLS